MSTLDLESHSIQTTGLHPILAVSPDATVGEVLASLREQRGYSALICADGRPLGVFTGRDAVRFLASRGDLATPIREVMTEHPVVLGEADSVGTAIVRMSRGGFRSLPVVDEGGAAKHVVSVAGVLRFLVERMPVSVYNLPPSSNQCVVEREGA